MKTVNENQARTFIDPFGHVRTVKEMSPDTKKFFEKHREEIEKNKPKFNDLFSTNRNENNFLPARKLMKGLILLLISYFVYFQWYDFIYNDGIKKDVVSYLVPYISDNSADIIGSIVNIVALFLCVYAPISGAYRVLTFNMFLYAFDGPKTVGWMEFLGKNTGSLGNHQYVDRVMQYRDAKMGCMVPDEAAELYIQTSKLDNIVNGSDNGKYTQRAADYINAKLGTMDNEKGLEYLKGK